MLSAFSCVRRLIPVIVVLAGLCACSQAMAQEGPATAPAGVVLQTKARSAQEVCSDVFGALPEANKYLSAGPGNVVVVRSVPPEMLDLLKELIARYDVARETLMVHIRIVRGEKTDPGKKPGALGEDLADVQSVLESGVLMYDHFQLDGTISIVAEEGKSVKLETAPAGVRLQVEFRTFFPNDEGAAKHKAVNFESFDYKMYQAASPDLPPLVSLSTSFSVPIGGSIIVGTSPLVGKSATIFVLTAEPAP